MGELQGTWHWPSWSDDTSGMKRGYYTRENGTLGKVIDGRKLSDSDDEHSSSHHAKRAKLDLAEPSAMPAAGPAAEPAAKPAAAPATEPPTGLPKPALRPGRAAHTAIQRYTLYNLCNTPLDRTCYAYG